MRLALDRPPLLADGRLTLSALFAAQAVAVLVVGLAFAVALLWRGEDWPEPLDRGEWQDGHAVLGPHDLRRGRYHGPLAMPSGVAALFRLNMLVGAV